MLTPVLTSSGLRQVGHPPATGGGRHDVRCAAPRPLATAPPPRPALPAAATVSKPKPTDKQTIASSSSNRDSAHRAVTSVSSSVSRSVKGEEDMNFKKDYIRRGISPPPPGPPRAPTGPVSDGIDVNRSLTEQLAKRTRDQYSVNGDARPSYEPSADHLKTPHPSAYHSSELREGVSKPEFHPERHAAPERHSAFTSVPRSNNTTPATEDRADSRASDSQIPTHLIDDKRPGSRHDDIRSVRSSPGSSPLVVDRYEAVNPYRDPELMRKNPVQSNVQNILAAQQHKMNPSTFPPSAVPGASSSSQTAAAAAAAGLHQRAAAALPSVRDLPPQLPAPGLLSSLPSTLAYSTTPQLPPTMSLHHGFALEAMAAVRAQQQQFATAAAMHQQLMSGYPAPAMATLEAMWRGKLPAGTPQGLPLRADSLLPADLAAIHREQIQQQLQLEQERRDRAERLDRDRREQDRLEQERREKERKEILER